MDSLFSERNRAFTLRHLLCFAGIMVAFMCFASVMRVYMPQSFDTPHEYIITIAALSALTIVLSVIMYTLRLTVTVYPSGVEVRHLGHRIISKDEIASVEVVDVKPMLHFGGYGVRDTPTRRGYIVGGMRQGIRIVRHHGRPVTICSARPVELRDAIAGIIGA